MAMKPTGSLHGHGMIKWLGVIAVAIGLIAFSGLIALAITHRQSTLVRSTRPVYVSTAVLRLQEPCTTTHCLAGVVVPSKRSEMGFARTGRLKRLYAVEGDCIEAGAVLAELDSSSLQAELTVARAELKLAERRLKGRPLSQHTLSSKYSGVTMNHPIGVPDSYLSAEALIERWTSLVNQLEVQLAECQLRAPYKARVVKTYMSEGSIVTADRPIMLVVCDEELVAKVALPSEHIEHVGSSVDTAFAMGDCQLAGKLKAITPAEDVEQTCEAVFTVPGLLPTHAGAPIRLNLEVPTGTHGFRIPKNALHTTKDGMATVLVVTRESKTTATDRQSKSIVSERRVEVLQTLEDSLIVAGDVRTGHRIVTQRSNELIQGQEVWYSDRKQWLNEVWAD